MMHNVEIAPGVYSVGAVDWTKRNFHGYETPRGVTYNAYLIVDEKICLVDTVKAPFTKELLERVSQIVDLEKIDYIVCNHTEPDHSSALPFVMEKTPQAKVVLTAQGKASIIKHYQKEYDFQVVKEGDVLDLGRKKLHFITMPMLHWPDSMASYLDGEEILFSNDAFGQHICTNQCFDDENNISDIMDEASKYYSNILMPYNRLIGNALGKTETVPIKMIAPSHGVIWRTHIKDILVKYEKWGSGYNNGSIVIVYDSMWGATEDMARRILEGVSAAGVVAKLHCLTTSSLSDIINDSLECGGIIVGSSTQHNDVLPTMGGFLTYLKGLRPVNKIGAAFGAYGWAGGAQKSIEESLTASGIAVESSNLSFKWVADQDEREKCFNFGLEFAKKVQGNKE
ncbi:FprA family A-type flavoprotein [Pelosinus sp. sgz500959]|uniref:FprA family A-type flavoprotein n=1 Tax=Pelosinus sp. sgz500959 TaxID=3242472 RepID=UPI00366CE9B7